MTKAKNDTGALGEQYAAEYLEKNGHEILSRNFSSRFGEIDIISRTISKFGHTDKPYSLPSCICFTEVKTRKENSLVTGFESITPSKQKKIRKTAEYFIVKNENKLKLSELQPRFDCAEVSVSDNGIPCGIRYIENAF